MELGPLHLGALVPAAGGPVASVTSARAEEAAASGAETIVASGSDVSRTLRRAGYTVRSYLPLPDPRQPAVLLPVGDRAATRFGLTQRRHGGTVVRLRDEVFAAAGPAAARATRRPRITVATRSAAPPAVVSAAGALIGAPIASWLPTFPTAGDAYSRGVTFLFAPGAAAPGWACKLSPLQDEDAAVRHEEEALTAAQSMGGALALRAPRFFGRAVLGGRHLSVESVAPGRGLHFLLGSAASQATQTRALERVVSWLDDIAEQTRSSPVELEAQRRHIAREVLPAWAGPGADPSLLEATAAVSAVFVHGDLWLENVLVDRTGAFTVIDWEFASAHGFPLFDLVRFASLTLPVLDGARTSAERERAFVELWTARAPSSPLLFSWLARAAARAAVPRALVPALVTLAWLASPVGNEDVYALARAWVEHPELGQGWSAW